jgi:hypothetical protein
MTTYYVDSTVGSDTSPFDTWAKASTSIDGLTTAVTLGAGDVIYVSSVHTETDTLTVTWFGVALKCICADKSSGAPPATIATGAVVTFSGNVGLTISTVPVYVYGITFQAGRTSAAGLTCGAGSLMEQCSFQLTGTGTATITPNTSTWLNCTVKFSAAGQFISGNQLWRWIGGSLLAGGTNPTDLLGTTSVGGTLEAIDLSNAATTTNINSATSTGMRLTLRNIKLPSSWTGKISGTSVTNSGPNIVQLMSCDSAGTNYVLHRETQWGDVYSEITIVRTGGATDGITPLSWKAVSVAGTIFPVGALQTGEFVIWNDATGSARTVTVEFLHDSVTGLKDNEIWLEVEYYGASGNPQGTLATSAPDALASGSTLASSSATWTTTGISNPNKQKLSVTFTPQLKGFFIASVKLAKASYTVYVDPKMTVT